MLLYNASMSFFLRDKLHAVYALFVMSYGLLQFSMNRMSELYFWPNSEWLMIHSIPVLIYTTFMCCAFLFIILCKPKKAFKNSNAIINKLIFIPGMIGLISVFIIDDYSILNKIMIPFAVWTSIILIVIALISFTKHETFSIEKKLTGYFLVSWSLFFVGVFLMSLRNIGIIPQTLMTSYGIQFGALSQLILLSFSVSLRFSSFKKKNSILEREKIKSEIEFLEISRQSDIFKAIAHTTQSLAHDVRKPFTMFKMIIDAVDGEEDPQEAKQILRESLPEVQQAMASVNGMIADVLEIGSESTPVVESANPETLIEATLNETFRVYPDSKVNVTYSFSHKHKVSVDTLKIGRVFSNIVGNAVQAMGRKGSLWFKTDEIEEDGKCFILFCLGNGGSFIPAENLPKLFDAFFTSGKKGGTGLGLAISQKIVLAHGGRIWCDSDAQRGVEFFFTLPKSVEQMDIRPQPLPISSAAIVATFERLRGHSQSGSRVEVDPLEVSLEKEILKLVQAMKAPLDVLIVDDEGLYRNSLAALVNRSDDLKEHLHLSFAVNSAQALEAAKTMPALVIQDVDLGKDSLNGYEVLKALRAEGFQGVVCIHSNRSLPEDYRVAMEAGADAVLPKPMSRSHFLKLALQAAERMHERLPLPSATHTSLPEFAVVDDSTLVLRAWQRKSKGQATVHTFESPDAFRRAQSADENFLSRLYLVVTDFYFAQGVADTGLSFGQELKKVFAKPVLLSSDGEFNTADLVGYVDTVIAKDPVSWVELEQVLKSKGDGA
jgi:signal transduction histidine kinase/DNA-binding response OmpR family regulator